MVVGKYRIKVAACAIDALAHGSDEGFLRPPTNARFTVRRNVRRINPAERRFEREAARIELAARCRVTDIAVPDLRQFGTASDTILVETLRGWGFDRLQLAGL